MTRRRPAWTAGGSARMPVRGHSIVIVSGKGGVGKTNLALNLGIHLSRRGLSTILVDANFGLANANVLMNRTPQTDGSGLRNVTNYPYGSLVEGPDGLRVLCSISGLSRENTNSAQPGTRNCASLLAQIRAQCDVLLVDCPVGVGRTASSFALAGDHLLLTTTPEPTALTSTYAALKVLHHQGYRGPVGVVANMAASRRKAERAIGRLQSVAAHFLGLKLDDCGHVLRDPHVPAAVKARVPVLTRYPQCGASVCIGRISERILPAAQRESAPIGLWTQVASLFL